MKCPVCSADVWKNFILTKDFFLTMETFNLAECKSCGLIITENAPGKSEIGKYYKSENYISHSDTHQQSLFSYLYKAARNIMLKKKFNIIHRHKPFSGRLLDLGCGTGYFIHYMSAKKWDCVGVEQDKDAKEFAIKNFNLSVLSPDNFINNNENETFDVITLWHVLEHLDDLHDYINKINQNLKKDGILIVALPNPESFDADYFKEYWAAWDVPRHLWHFKKNTLVQLLKSYDFDLSETHTMPFDLFYVTLLSASYKKKFKWFDIPYVALLGLTQTIFNKHKCSSLTYVFKKKN
jgi:2-polyprenyl-3-methyl-5-hydroxy-6-metoxy-1,4-benzoquinol methylase